MRLQLHHRIVLPVAALAIALTAALAMIALSITSSTVSNHIRMDVVGTTAVVSRGGFAVNPAVLSTIKQVTGAEVVTFDASGLVATTLDPDVRDSVVAQVIEVGRGLDLTGDALVERELGGTPPYYVAYTSVDDRPDTVVALLRDNSEVDEANRMLTRSILGGAAASLVLLILGSQLVARRVTRPITELARFADNVSAPGGKGRATVDTDDEVGRLGAAFNDMLDRLDLAQAEAVKSEKLVLAGMFAARVAHDVRNPLSSMKMQTQLLQAQVPPDSEARGIADAMLMDIDQVEFVVANLLNLGRPSSLTRSTQDINALLDGVLRQVTPQCDHRRIAVVRDFGQALPLLQLDPGRMTQALLNLAMNAVEALRENGTLTVRSRLSDDRAHVIVQFDDDGVGVDAAAIERIFDPFVSTKPDGVGLGLVNAKSAVERHGGTITLEARVPTGTRVTITLPVAV